MNTITHYELLPTATETENEKYTDTNQTDVFKSTKENVLSVNGEIIPTEPTFADNLLNRSAVSGIVPFAVPNPDDLGGVPVNRFHKANHETLT